MYCLEYLETNIDWLQEKLQPFMDQGYYCIIDSPGQAELYTHHESLHHIVHTLTKPELFHLQLAAVHLVDCHHCTDAFKFIAAALVSLQAMVRLELPHINILSKVDLKETFQHTGTLLNLRMERLKIEERNKRIQWGNINIYVRIMITISFPFLLFTYIGKDLDDFTTDLDLYRILPTLIDDNENESSSLSSSSSSTSSEEGKIRPRFPPRTINYLKKYQKLNERIVEIVTDYNLVSFIPVSIKDPRTLSNAINMIDKATGYVDIKPKITQMKEKRLENQGKEIHQTVSSTASVLSGKILEDDNDEEEIQEDDD